MQFGLAPVQSQASFTVMFHQAKLAESFGFDVLWAHEHHSQGMMYPSPLITLAALAGQTQRIKLGTNMLLLPLYHPLRVAESAAMVDVLSDGRLLLGVSAGYAKDEFQAFDVELRERGHRMEEGLSLIRAVWTQDPVSFHGTRCQLTDFSLFPKPIQQPAPPIYVGALANSAIRRAARLADGHLLSAGSTLAELGERIAFYHTARKACGYDTPPRLPLAVNRVTYVAKNRADKESAQRLFSERYLHFYDQWGHADVQKLDARERSYEETSRQHFIIGEASECVDLIQEYAHMGIGHIACLMNFGNPPIEMVEESLRRFGENVLPRCAPL